ncbi:AraC family transcriptional regulator [Telmatospirillum siberiense]|uniref:AraC family transcriptional regulator n=1 Tax=Telmatospirillum siberiense TaxID=382514 RepID=A0A2N3PMB9_9PROT|nr:AraC family transcriptional regulator [Telmatospirillum siberiense]PKU21532.1 AraC family transcriptional regulator [Telmatospirillum siberiense]
MARTDPLNRVRYWRDVRIPGLALLEADFTGHDYAPHSHDAFVIAMTEAGGSEFNSRGRTEEATAARLLVFNPDEPHSGRMARSPRWRYRSFYLDERAIAGLTARLGLAATPYFTSNLFTDPDLIAVFLALHHAHDRDNDALRESELLSAGLGGLIARHSAAGRRMPLPPGDRRLFQRVSDVMRQRHTESPTLEDLGRTEGLTCFQLIGLFKRVAGITPHAYLTQIRLGAAMRHLRAGVPIAQAAVMAGFYDQAALTTHFKRAYGFTPRQFVRAELGRAELGRPEGGNFGQ